MWWVGWGVGMAGIVIFVAVLCWWGECCDYGPLHRPSFRSPRRARKMAVRNARQQVDDIFERGAQEMVRVRIERW